ncbi:MAG: ATPase, T2SS/T4P/T4SS family [Candidatus Omnitrophota bacterium]
MATRVDEIISGALIEKGLVSREDLLAIQEESARSNEELAALLIKRGVVKEGDILDTLSEAFGIPQMSLKEANVERSITEKVPLKFASYYKFMPVQVDGNVLTIAVSMPLDVKAQDDIRTQLGFEVKEVLSREGDILDLLKSHYGIAADTIQKIMLKTPQGEPRDSGAVMEKLEDIERLAEDASVVKLVNQIILEGYKKRATDIHIEPFRGKIRLRYRIDGVLYDAHAPEDIRHFLLPILSRIKIMSNLNIVERRLPQDGRAVVKMQNQTLDLRISSMPTPYGESVVIRILPTKMLLSLKELGLSPSNLNVFGELIKRPYGIIFVTGPTGSGKTTTLYACLNKINTDERKIITIEDPIEYEMSGITQIQVAPEIGLDFARGLRSMLRHDPDVMMVGEVRDLETAEISIRVALTGHLVFSTLHTNDAASGMTRLIDIGLEPYLVSSSVVAFIAQRLVRVICPHCKEKALDMPLELKAQIARELRKNDPPESISVFRGKGCRECNFTGFYGRTALYEILLVDDEIKDLVLGKTSSNRIKKRAIQKGMSTLRQEGWKKVIAGLTTPEEILNITQSDEGLFTARTEEADAAGTTVSAESAPVPPPSLTTGVDTGFQSPGGLPDANPEPSGFGADGRVFKRAFTKINVTYRVMRSHEGADVNGPVLFSVAKNVSAGGVLLVSETSYPKETVLELKAQIPDGGSPVQCLAKVIRSTYRDLEGSFDVGACFLDLSSGERLRIDKFIEAQLG